MRLIYLAGPYKSDDEAVRQKRVEQYAAAVYYFAMSSPNLCLFSPVLHCVSIDNLLKEFHDFSFWAHRDFFMIKKSSAMWVLTIPGWQESYGVAQELEYAESIDREVFYVIQDSADWYITDARPTHTSTIG